jgi:transcriptional regulator with XRE-family HTH domain
LREATGKTQIDVARESQMDQGDISRLETRTDFEDCQMATLRRYVEALGGSLEMVARFGDKRITIAGVEPQPKKTAKVLKRANLPRRSRSGPRS